jgi:hypothetical protein
MPAETAAHRNLKRLALIWAQANGFSCCAQEVVLPNCTYRADLAAYRPASEPAPVDGERAARRKRQAAVGTTAIFECKQSRADLLHDCAQADPALKRLAELHERRAVLERLLRVHHPSLVTGDSLFPEYETHNTEAAGHAGFRSVLRQIGILQSKIYRNNKFEKLVRYRCANLFYLVASEAILAAHELPLHWGLLAERDGALVLARKPVFQPAPWRNNLALLHRIAAAGTRGLNREHGIGFDEIAESRRGFQPMPGGTPERCDAALGASLPR